jgi:hypothetical protein
MLTARQSKFVEHLFTLGSGAAAARKAGYSEKSARQIATENLSKPSIKAAIAAKQAEAAQQMVIDREVIVGGIIGAIATARQERDGGSMLRGYVALAKLLGMDKPETQSGVPNTENSALQSKFDNMSDAELQAVIAGQSLPQVVN